MVRLILIIVAVLGAIMALGVMVAGGALMVAGGDFTETQRNGLWLIGLAGYAIACLSGIAAYLLGDD